jgi:hypothetical protein
MRTSTRLARLLRAAALGAAILCASTAAHSQVSGGTDRNVSKMANYQNECAIAKNPTNKLQLFAACNNATGGLFAARSTDGGFTWSYPDAADKTIADGDAGQGAAACCDPTLAWDTFGNLFITYIDAATTSIVTLRSTDGGLTFTTQATFGPASVDQPTVVADAGAVWVIWNQSNQMVARGAAVTGLGTVGAFNALQTVPNTTGCSFGDIAIAPGGAVVQVCETPTGGQGPATLRVNTDADGLGPGNFNAGAAATTTNVGGFDFIPAQNVRSVDAEAGLAFDRDNVPHPPFPASPTFGRLYLVYTEEPVNENNDTNILVRFSDNNGGTWSPPIQANLPDASTRSQFLPRIASNRLSGNIAVCWHDARNSGTNTTMQEFCTIATPAVAGPTFMANVQIGDGASVGTGSNPPQAGQLDIQFGDYSGLDYFQGVAHPIWADTSNSTMDNPDLTTRFDAYTDRVSGGAAANEGDPHITTVDGIHYDFQSAGEFVVLRDADGLQIQTRQTPVATTFNPGANPYTGLATCVSLNSAVAAQVGSRRVTFEPNLSGVPDPSGLQLRVDGVLTTLGPAGLDLGSGGRVASSPGGGIEVEFPNGTLMVVTPNFWTAQGKWYLNVNVSRTPATEGVMGALAPGSWLPALPGGGSLGPKPADLHQRYLDLNKTFADAWRVTNKTSLFDYAPGTSTATFTLAGWPKENPPCNIPDTKPVKPLSLKAAQQLCRPVTDRARNANCVFDVRVTGEPGFAKAYQLTQKIENGATTTTINVEPNPAKPGEPMQLLATVARRTLAKGVPAGSVQFLVDGEKTGDPVRLDPAGRAVSRTANLRPGRHQVVATYLPAQGTPFLASTSPARLLFVGDQK